MIPRHIPKQALLLSQDPMSLASLTVILAQNEFSTHQASNVEDAISAIETFTPSVIIAEQDVIDGTTAECIEKARIHGEPAAKCILMTFLFFCSQRSPGAMKS